MGDKLTVYLTPSDVVINQDVLQGVHIERLWGDGELWACVNPQVLFFLGSALPICMNFEHVSFVAVWSLSGHCAMDVSCIELNTDIQRLLFLMIWSDIVQSRHVSVPCLLEMVLMLNRPINDNNNIAINAVPFTFQRSLVFELVQLSLICCTNWNSSWCNLREG